MIRELIRLQFLKTFRSTSFAKSAMANIFLGFLVLVLLSYVFAAGIFLPRIIDALAEGQDPIEVLNSYLIYFFLVEFMYRYFLQKLPVLDLESLLHLPIGKRRIISILLLRSFISAMSIIPILLFLPSAFQIIAPEYGSSGAVFWIGSIVFTSWTLHWFMLWFKQRFEDGVIGLIVVFAVLVLGAGSSYMGWFNLGELSKPIFDFALSSPIPTLVLLGLMIGTFILCRKFYLENAYLEDLAEEDEIRFVGQSIGFFSRFGLAGELANLEWKLIIRHKKSRSYL